MIKNLFLIALRNLKKDILIAAVIAFPVAWYFMSNWLKIFPYNRGLSLIPFAISAVIILITAVVTASFHSAKAAVTKPVKSLRTE